MIAGAGVVVGMVGAIIANRLLSSLLYGVDAPTDNKFTGAVDLTTIPYALQGIP
jgi:uncharacterized membrane protein YeaQ/YmgE (transglycosylase-associated protein family)